MDKSVDTKSEISERNPETFKGVNLNFTLASNHFPFLPYGDQDSVWKRIRIVPFVDDNGNPVQS